MPASSKTNRAALVREFERTLADCQELYRASARRCADEHPELISRSPDSFVRLMDDLHRGLLIKVFVEVARVDWHWSAGELELGGRLIEHIWGKRLAGAELRRAIRHMIDKADELKLPSLVHPFARLAPLAGEVGHLTTIVMRLANLVAKIDGELGPDELDHIKKLQVDLDRHLDRALPLDAPGAHEEAAVAGTRVVKTIAREAAAVRSQCELTPDESPAPVPKSAADVLAESLDELDALIGLTSIKHEVRTLVNFLKIQEERGRHGLPKTSVSLHMVFSGNPGTGKTTVARIVGRIFGGLGILAKGHLIETDRSGLVAQYAGQTGPKTNKKIDEALDGVLFIDEAYSLVADEGRDAYGHEAVQALLKRMEDERHRLVVILAGYDEPIRRLLASNPGLSSRFSRQLVFEDYTAPELCQIFERMAEQNHYRLPAATRARLLLGFHHLVEQRDEHFGNGRLVRNLFEHAIRRLANRVAAIAELNQKLLTTLEAEDIAMPDVPEEAWQAFDDGECRLRVSCPDCGQTSTLPPGYLGRRVRCKGCDHKFMAAWGVVERR